ncbi:hypothetical protein Glo7428_4193 [Gloeocapsa sp. PCC 7428]|nr:hypothetical protein Glo7428_4193 [Gloeocapsa sp. PCC 7428]
MTTPGLALHEVKLKPLAAKEALICALITGETG